MQIQYGVARQIPHAETTADIKQFGGKAVTCLHLGNEGEHDVCGEQEYFGIKHLRADVAMESCYVNVRHSKRLEKNVFGGARFDGETEFRIYLAG